MATPEFLCVQGLSRRFGGAVAVDGVSFALPRGEIFALLGSSGCGKSTLLRMLAGFEAADAGTVHLEGREISGLRPYERPINMMFQSYALFPHLSVQDNVAFGLRRHRWPAARVREQVARMLALVQMEAFAVRKPHQLSGGQQQRVALARSLALEPRLLLLDEPLGALDRKLRAQTQFELQRIIRAVGVTCVLVTHDQEEAMTLADRIAIMSAGRFLQVGSPREIYEAPASRFVADFVGTVNLLDGVRGGAVEGQCRVRTAAGDFFVPIANDAVGGAGEGQSLVLALRPEKIRLMPWQDPSQARTPARDPAQSGPDCGLQVLEGRVRERAYFGATSLYRVEVAGGVLLQASLPNDQRGATAPGPGERVRVCIDGGDLVVLHD
jgi:putrescine transport system ATP-binding protein